MKIKRKVEMNLPQLIEYAWDNDMRNKNFESEGGAIVYFDYDGNLTCARGFVPQDFFTVTYEEEITEDTKLEYSIEIYKVDNVGWVRSTEHRNVSISQMKNRGSIVPLSYYILNDDFTLTLIWTHEKGLVE